MMTETKAQRSSTETRRKLVDATLRLMLRQGFNATKVDQICAEAGLTKGSFFHYFATKEEMGRAALDAFAEHGTGLYSAAWADPDLDPLEQIRRLFEIMIGFTQQADPCVCMVGMMSQELSGSNPAMRQACVGHLTVWTDMMKERLEAATERYPVAIDFEPEQVAWFLNSLWQGSMLIGKTRGTPELIVNNLRLAQAFVDRLFGPISLSLTAE